MTPNHKLRKVCLCLFSIWIVAQIVLIFVFFNAGQRSDQGAYIRMATECFANGEWYPNETTLYSSYIWAPGFINFLILQLKLFGTVKVNFFINLLMNVGIAANVFYIAKRLFSERVAYWSVILFCLMYSNLFAVLPAGTEIPFLFLSISAFSLCINGKGINFLLAGVLLVMADWIRPLAMIFLLVIVVYMVISKMSWKKYVLFFVPYIAIALCLSCWTQSETGYFGYKSTTSGVNLIMTANDKAYGGVATSLHSDTRKHGIYQGRADKNVHGEEFHIQGSRRGMDKGTSSEIRRLVFLEIRWALRRRLVGRPTDIGRRQLR